MQNLDISFEDAIVVHSNKYNQNSGIIIWNFFFSSFYQDVVFKLVSNNKEFLTTYKNVNLPLFTGQKVKLVAVNGNVIAYIDGSTNVFYYLTNNLQRDLSYGININWKIIIPLLFLSFLLVLPFMDSIPFVPIIFLIPILLIVYQRVINFLLERKIDHLIVAS
jgi:hypothetical protein